MPDRPSIAVSLGDPAGIGPEVVARCLTDASVRSAARWTVFGSAAVLDRAAGVAGVTPDWWTVPAGSRLESAAAGRDVVVVDLGDPDVSFGDESARSGAASMAALETAIEAARPTKNTPSRCDAVATAPISKHAWHLHARRAGRRAFPGHTELLADRFRAKRVVMAFESPSLRVALATAHVPLNEIRNQLTIGRVFDAIELMDGFTRSVGVGSPRIAVCGLNPHAGERGLLGDEDTRLIEPAIRAAREQGIDAHGPFPGDTIFRRARLDGDARDFDAVVAMYHDQGLIPVKLLAFDDAVNVTLGLSTWRTSPDHGTAFDIAGKGIANPSSMRAAMLLAAKLARTSDDGGSAI